MNGDPKLYALLEELDIPYNYFEHPPTPTIEIARVYWAGNKGKHCKNLFFRNHKGNKHYLVVLDCECSMNIRAIEQMLGQGKLSFASEQRMEKYLGVKPGSVTPFGLIHDTEQHVHLFLDKNLQDADYISFHPCINTASVTISFADFVRFLEHVGNRYEWIDLY